MNSSQEAWLFGTEWAAEHGYKNQLHSDTYYYTKIQKYTPNCTHCFILFIEKPKDHLLGTPETSRRGRSTRKARRALTSNPPGLPPWPWGDGWVLAPSPSPSPLSSLVKNSNTTLKSLSGNKDKNEFKHCLMSDSCHDSQLNNWVFFLNYLLGQNFGSSSSKCKVVL